MKVYGVTPAQTSGGQHSSDAVLENTRGLTGMKPDHSLYPIMEMNKVVLLLFEQC